MRAVAREDGDTSIIERISGADSTAVVFQTPPNFAHARPDSADSAKRTGQGQYTEQSQKGQQGQAAKRERKHDRQQHVHDNKPNDTPTQAYSHPSGRPTLSKNLTIGTNAVRWQLRHFEGKAENELRNEQICCSKPGGSSLRAVVAAVPAPASLALPVGWVRL
jgi:hypothetical protein